MSSAMVNEVEGCIVVSYGSRRLICGSNWVCATVAIRRGYMSMFPGMSSHFMLSGDFLRHLAAESATRLLIRRSLNDFLCVHCGSGAPPLPFHVKPKDCLTKR